MIINPAVRCATCQVETNSYRWVCGPCALAGHEAKLPALVVGIAGKAHHGKTTLAQVLEAEFMTRGLRTFCGAVSDVVLAEAYDKKVIGTCARDQLRPYELQKLVTYGAKRRAEREDYWLERVTMQVVEKAAQVAVVHGLRFPNEVAWAQGRGVVVRVERPGHVATDRDPHDPMETSLDDYPVDFRIIVGENQLSWLTLQGGALATLLVGRLTP